jgi:hypothetical protein
MQIERYQGTPDRPFPPRPIGYREIDVPFHDEARRARATGLLGELPPWSFVDEPGPGGVTRYFAFEHPLGRSVGAVFLRRDGSSLLADGTLGQTNPNFVVATPAQIAANPPSTALANAAVALLTYMAANGIPNEHVYSQPVYDFQFAYNDDALGQANGNAGFLSEDGGYGPNTRTALSAIAGAQAPPVNPAPAPPGTTPPTPTPTKPVAQASVAGGGGSVAAVILGVLVVGGLVTAGLAAKHPIRF